MNIPSSRFSRPFCCFASKNAGFTLFEVFIAMLIFGILASMAVPSLLDFWERRQVVAVQQMLYQAIRSAQRDAMQHKEERQFSLRQQGDYLEWSSHSRNISPVQVTHWESLPAGVVLAERDNTLPEASGVRYVRFDFQGDVKYRLGTVTLTGASRGQVERCVIISTLIGAMRKGEGHTTPNSNERYCY